MRRNVRRLNREVNGGQKPPCEQQQAKEEPAMSANGRTKRRKAASLTELKRFYDAAVDAASEVLSITSTAVNPKREGEGGTIAGKRPGSAAADGGAHRGTTVLLAARSSFDEHVLPPPSALSAGGNDDGEITGANQRTRGSNRGSSTTNGRASTRSEGDASRERRTDQGGDCVDRRYRSPALLMLSGDDVNKEWHGRGAEGGAEKGIAAESSGETFREVLRKKLEATGGTRCKLGSTKRQKNNRAATGNVEDTKASRHGGGDGGGRGRGGGDGERSGGCPDEGAGGSGPLALPLFSAGRTGKKPGKGTINRQGRLGKRQSSSLSSSTTGANSSRRGAVVDPHGPCFRPPVASHPTLPGFKGYVDRFDYPPTGTSADVAPSCLPLPPCRDQRCARSSPSLGLSPALLEALEKAEKVPDADDVVSARLTPLKTPFSEFGVDDCARLQPTQVRTADRERDTGSVAWRKDAAAGRTCAKAPFAESSVIKPAELLLRVCGNRERNAAGRSQGQRSERTGTTSSEPAVGAETGSSSNNNNKRNLPDGRAPLMPYWRRRKEPFRANAIRSSLSSSSCSSSFVGTNASTSPSNSATSATKRVTFSPSTRAAGSSPGSTARAPVAAATKTSARKTTGTTAATVAAIAAAGKHDGDNLEGNEDGPYPVRFGIMQQRQFNGFPGDSKAGLSSPSQQGEKPEAGG